MSAEDLTPEGTPKGETRGRKKGSFGPKRQAVEAARVAFDATVGDTDEEDDLANVPSPKELQDLLHHPVEKTGCAGEEKTEEAGPLILKILKTLVSDFPEAPYVIERPEVTFDAFGWISCTLTKTIVAAEANRYGNNSMVTRFRLALCTSRGSRENDVPAEVIVRF